MATPRDPRRELAISVVGTTSAGKSTLLNALMGRWLLPWGVQEATTSTISVRHSTRRSSAIMWIGRRKPKRAESDEVVRAEIAAAMQRPRTSVEVEICTARGSWPRMEERGLPRWARPRVPIYAPGKALVFRDLPGVPSVDAHARLAGIRAECRRSGPTLVVFNSEETDPYKDQAILETVHAALYEIGDPPSRLIYVLSRFDAHHRDEHPMDAVDRAEQARVKSIRSVVSRLGGRPRRSAIDVYPVASRMALAAESLSVGRRWLGANDRRTALDQVAERVEDFLPWSKDLPRRIESWSENDLRSVLRGLRVASGMTGLLRAVRRAARLERLRAARRRSRGRRVAT